MTREIFITLLSKNMLYNIVYEFYKEEALNRGLPPLPFLAFNNAFRLWKHNRETTQRVIHYYKMLYDVRTITDGYDNIIKYL